MFAGGLVIATVATFSLELGEKGCLVTSDARCLCGIIIRFDKVDHLRLVHANYGLRTRDKLINLTSTASCSHSLLRTVTFLVKEEDIRSQNLCKN